MNRNTRTSRPSRHFTLRILPLLLPLLPLLPLVAALLLAGCGGRKERRAEPEQTAAEERPAVFLPMLPPAELDAAGQQSYLADHYWDRFDFADTAWMARLDTTQLLRAYADYVSILDPNDGEPLRRLMGRAKGSRYALRRFHDLAERVLYDPNSPLRSDELYIPVLEAVVESPLLDEYEKIAPAHDLHLARQNRVGEPANDFRYRLASGAAGRLYGLKSAYVLLFIHNPGCPMCREIREELAASPMLAEMVERGELTVLALYPDEEIDEWRRESGEIPSSWLNARDEGCRMRREELYDLKAIPSLYLLDREKRVMVKDASDVGLVEWLLDHAR